MALRRGSRLREVEVQALDAARLEPLIGRERMVRFEQVAEAAQAILAGCSVLNVNSTAAGGGVAETLQTLAYARGAGVDARWLVIEGDPPSSRRSGSITASTATPATAGAGWLATALRAGAARNADDLGAHPAG